MLDLWLINLSSRMRVIFSLMTWLLIQHNTKHPALLPLEKMQLASYVEYDSETNCCIGFVLPLNNQGLPEIDSFLAVSFEAIEMFLSS